MQENSVAIGAEPFGCVAESLGAGSLRLQITNDCGGSRVAIGAKPFGRAAKSLCAGPLGCTETLHTLWPVSVRHAAVGRRANLDTFLKRIYRTPNPSFE